MKNWEATEQKLKGTCNMQYNTCIVVYKQASF